jgi:hypothetical protein
MNENHYNLKLAVCTAICFSVEYNIVVVVVCHTVSIKIITIIIIILWKSVHNAKVCIVLIINEDIVENEEKKNHINGCKCKRTLASIKIDRYSR